MQLKGLVKFFTAALILISLYQLSFTFIVKSKDKEIRLRANKEVKAENTNASEEDLRKLEDLRFDKIADSLQGETVFSFLGLKKFTYLELKEQELNLGLDLQGGMNVTLEVSLDELVRSMSNNPRDPLLNKAIADANNLKANSQESFTTLFGQAFEKANPGTRLAYLFTKSSEKEIALNSTNEVVLNKIRKEAKDAIKRTYNVLLTRIDKFGVAQPNVNLDADKGIITVELAGVRNPERVRDYLQATAKLQFFEAYTNQEVYGDLLEAETALVLYLSGDKTADTTAKNSQANTTAVTVADSNKTVADTSLSSLLSSSDAASKAAAGGDTSQMAALEQQKKYPLRSKLYIPQELGNNSSPVLGYVAKKDTAALNGFLRLDVVKNKFPNNIKFLYGAEKKSERRNPNAPLQLYAVKTVQGAEESKLEGDKVVDARMDYNPVDGKPEVSMTMDAMGSRIWQKMTAESKGRFVAIVLDDKIYSAPRVNDEIAGGRTSISGGFSVEEATDLANILKSGKLPAPARIVQEQVVGPTLGEESTSAGFTAIILSFLAIFALMLVYYSTSGWVANISLTLNLLFTVGILSALHATLTLPGIAGLVLGIGMAVDAHVLIFERIKEELALGKTHQQAIVDGYKRSNAPVLDGHIAQLITAFILFTFGLGPVLGFATTQLLSITISLFCGILVSRLIKEIYTASGKRHFKYFTPVSRAVFRKAHFDFMKIRKVTYFIAVVIVIAGISSVFYGFDYGVEFAGGRSYSVKLDQKAEVANVREKLHTYFQEYPIVKTIGNENHINITTAYLIKQPGQEIEQQVQQQLYEGLTKEGFISANVDFATFVSKYILSSQTVLPTISDDLIQGAKLATILSLLAISVYILLRFRKWQYSLGTFISLLFNICATLAVFSFFRGHVPFALEIDQHFIAAILTVIGFSMNDTIIVFDRVREYFRKNPDEDKKSVINRAINDTLPRTVMTSLTVFIVVLILFIVGGEVTRGFAFAMLIGIITGTFSSIFVAGPVLVDTDKSGKLKNEVDREAKIEELKKLA